MTTNRGTVQQWNGVGNLSWRDLTRFLSAAERRNYWFSRQLGNFRRRVRK